MVSVGILLAFFYNVVVSWSLWYLVTSLSSLIIPEYKLEWAYCGHSYNSKWCHSNLDDEICLYNNTIALNGTCSIAKNGNYTSSSVKEYWNRKVLGHVGYDWSNFVIFLKNFLRCYWKFSLKLIDLLLVQGTPRIQSVIALTSAWILVGCCLLKGVKTSGR